MSSAHWTTDPEVALDVRVGTPGTAAGYLPRTIIDVFQDTVTKHGERTALGVKRKGSDGVLPRQWRTWTWQQYYDECCAFAKALIHLRVSSFKTVNIIGFNSPEWLIANNGAILASCIAAGIYTTNTPEACQYITEHSKAEVLVLEDNKQLKKYSTLCGSLPHLKAIVVWGEPVDEKLAKMTGKQVFSWSQFLVLGVSVSDQEVENRQAYIKPGHCSTLIYTSGTTGPPKAVMISHDNVTWTTKNLLDNYMDVNHTERFVSFLPLSHIAAQIIDLHAPMYLGGATYFAQPDALKGSLTNTLKDAKPTIFFGVPRVWEKIQEKMVQIGRESTGIKKTLGTWCKAVAAEKNRRAQYGEEGGAPCGYGCANSLVLMKIKEALGLECTKACFTAAAPIAPETLYYFASLDIPVYEVFGQSECTGPQTISFAGNWKIGYCGRPMLGTETKIAPVTNELCYRGRHIFMGYMYMPDKTEETIDADGYLHSGDVAEFDENDHPDIPKPSGFMKITGRIKELIITAGGENIPPVLIENEMKAAMVALSNCMVIGDRRKYLTMLVSLKCEVNAETGEPTDKLAADSLFVGSQIGSQATTMSAAAVDPLWKKYIDEGMKVANSKTTSNAQIVQKWKMLPVDFSEKAGELTPTLKLKRNVVAEKYASFIDTLYEEE